MDRKKRFAAASGSGSTGAAELFNSASFYAPLLSSVVPARGAVPFNFTRGSVATVQDHEGVPRNCISGEVRFTGARRNYNPVVGSSSDFTHANWVKNNITAANLSDTITVDGTSLPATRLTLTGGLSLHNINQSARFPNGSNNLWQAYTVNATNITSKRVIIEFTSPTNSIRFRWTGPQTITIESIDPGCEGAWKIHGDYVATFYAKTNNVRTATCSMSLYLGLYGAYDGDGQYATVARAWGGDVSGAVNQNPPEYVSVGGAKLNEVPYTEEIDNASWTKQFCTITPNAITAPNGTVSAAKIVEDLTAATWHGVSHNGTAPAGVPVTLSVYLKAAERTWARIRIGSGVFEQTFIDLATGTLGTALIGGVGSALLGRTITSVGNGWYRCTISGTSDSVVNARVFTAITDGVDSVDGDGVSGIYVWGFQLTQGIEVTPYFPVGNVYPFHGACVDGVKYFEWENGNTINNNVVTEAQGRQITQTRNQFGRLPGTASSYFSTPDPATRLTGDQDQRVYLSPDDITPSALQILISKWDSTIPSLQTIFYLNPDGTLTYIWSSTGLVLNTIATSTSAISPAIGQGIWLRFTHDLDNGAVGNDVKFWTSLDGTNWTQLGTTVTTAGVTTIADTNRAIWLGAHDTATANTFTGMIRYAQIRNGIDGPIVVNFDVNDWGSGTSFVSTITRETWTLNGGAVINNYPLRKMFVEVTNGFAMSALEASTFAAGWTDLGTPTRVANPVRVGDFRLDEIGDDSAVALEGKSRVITFTGDGVKTISFLWKAGTSVSTVVRLLDTTAPLSRVIAGIVPTNGAPVVTCTVGGEERAPEALGNGVYRIYLNTTAVTALNNNVLEFYPATDTAGFGVAAIGTVNIGGVQCENPSSASSLSTATRSADVPSYTVALLPTNGTVYIEMYRQRLANSVNGRGISLNDGTNNERVELLQVAGASSSTLLVIDGGATQANFGPLSSFSANVVNKAAGRFQTNNCQIAANGLLATPVLVATMPTVSQIQVGHINGGTQLNGNVGNIRVWNTPMSDINLQTMTR